MGSARFASGLAFAGFAFDGGLGRRVVALLGDADDVEHAIDSPVPIKVEAMPDRRTVTFARRQRNCTGAAPARELRFAIGPCRVADFADQRRGGDWFDTGFVARRRAVGVEQCVELGFELADLTAPRAVLVDEREQPSEPIGARERTHDVMVECWRRRNRDSIFPS